MLKHVRNVPWEMGDVIPDYILGPTTCALFLRYGFQLITTSITSGTKLYIDLIFGEVFKR